MILEEGLNILRAEMKNLGLNIKIAEKRKLREGSWQK